jgi:flagellar hook-length control protein FliK
VIGLVSHTTSARRAGRPEGDAAAADEAPTDFAALLAQVTGAVTPVEATPAGATAAPAGIGGTSTTATPPAPTPPEADVPAAAPIDGGTGPATDPGTDPATTPPIGELDTAAEPGEPGPPTLPADAPHGLRRRLDAPGAEHRSSAAPIVPPRHARRAADDAPADEPSAPPVTDGPPSAEPAEPAAPATPALPQDDAPAEPATPADPALPAVAAEGRLHRPEAPGATSPAAPAPPTGPVHEQVAVRLRDLQLDHGAEQSLTIDLHPAELGAVTVDLRMSEGTVHVTVRAEEPAAARLLEHHLDDLGTALDAGGLEVGELRMAPPEPPAPPPSTPGERDVLDRRRHRPDDDRPADPRPDRHDGPDLAFDALL